MIPTDPDKRDEVLMTTIPGDFAIMSIKITGDSFTDGFAITTLAIKLDGAALAPSVAQFAIDYGTEVWANAGLTAYTFDRVIGRTATETEEYVANSAGTQTGAPQTVNGCLLVKKVSGLNGRANRGRMYVPGVLDEASVDASGRLSPADTAAFQVLFSNFGAQLAAHDLQGYLLHAAGGAPTLVNGLLVESQMGTQRRRMRR